MAIEIKTDQCLADEEEAVIRLYQDFGWNLKSSQQIYSKESHLETREGHTYSVTETVNYIKLVFERDTKIPCYSELKSLEERYWELLDHMPDKPKYPASMTIEEWAKKTEPDIRISKAGKWWSLLFWGGALLTLLLTGVYVATITEINEVLPVLGALSLHLFIIGGIIYTVSYTRASRAAALKKAIENTDADLRAKLEALYKPKHDVAVAYEEYLMEMDNVRRQAASLIE